MKAAKRRTGQATPRPLGRRALLLALAFAAAAVLYWTRQRPRWLYEEAQELISARPGEAERLLEESVAAAGGDYPDAQLLRCRALGATGRWDAALGLFSVIEDASKCDAASLVQLAREAQGAGKNRLAVMALSAANRPGPGQADALRALIPLEVEDAAPHVALDHCRLLERLAPKDAFAWEAEGRIQQAVKEPLAAVHAYREALHRQAEGERQAEIRASLAAALMDAGELTAAREQMDWLLARPEPGSGVRLKEAYLLRLEGRLNDALEKANKLVSESGGSAAALMLRGILYCDSKQFREAADDLSRVVTAQPFNKEAHYKLGQALQKLGEADKAAVHLDRSAELTRCALEILDVEAELQQDSGNRSLAARLADLYERAGRRADAERLRQQGPHER